MDGNKYEYEYENMGGKIKIRESNHILGQK
jgi:hypothetical protein